MDPKHFTRRLVALGAVMFLCALVFVVTLFDAQIVNGDDYLAQSVRANAKVETVKGTRGVITDRNGKVLVSNRAVYTLDFDSSLVPDDELNDALLRLIALMNAQGVEIKDSCRSPKAPPTSTTPQPAAPRRFPNTLSRSSGSARAPSMRTACPPRSPARRCSSSCAANMTLMKRSLPPRCARSSACATPSPLPR